MDEVTKKTSEILGLTPKNSRKIIESLITMGHIEDGSYLKSSTKSNRYSRSREFFSWIDTSGSSDPFRVQNILSSSKIAIVGLGGIGGSVAMNLASSGVSQIHIVDFDNVEEQGEEEANASDQVKAVELFGGDTKNLFDLDRENAARVYTAPAMAM